MRGPHASLAVKLAQRDPGRKFLLGERLQYVLLAGARLQDEAAEAPRVAAQYGLSPNYELYLRNKLQVGGPADATAGFAAAGCWLLAAGCWLLGHVHTGGKGSRVLPGGPFQLAQPAALLVLPLGRAA
jgi:hypothetical protein